MPILRPDDALRILDSLQYQIRNEKIFDNDKVVGLVAGVIHSLSHHPEATDLRTKLYSFFEPELLGVTGRALIVSMVMSLIKELTIDTKEQGNVQGSVSDREIKSTFNWVEKLVQELDKKSVLMAPATILNRDDYPIPTEHFFSVLEKIMYGMTENIDESGTDEGLIMIAQVAGLCRNQSLDTIIDLRILRSVITVLASKGRNQDARNYVENALQMTDGDLQRTRIAWFIFADTYARSNLLTEALIGIACFLSIPVSVSPEQGFLEGFVAVRVLRDAGFAPIARSFLAVADNALNHHVNGEQYRHRIGTMELQLDCMELLKGTEIEKDAISLLIQKAVVNFELTLENEPRDLAPCCANLATLTNRAKEMGVPVSAELKKRLNKQIPRLQSPQREILEVTVSENVTAASLSKLLNCYQASTYSRDQGFDLKMVKQMARNLLDSVDVKKDPESFIYAVEVLCDLRLTDGVAALLSQPERPFDTAIKLSLNGPPLFVCGLSSNGLTCAIFQNGRLIYTEKTDTKNFNPYDYHEWSLTYPHQYAFIEDPNEMFSSTNTLLFPQLPHDAIVVTNIRLQKLSPNLYRQDQSFTGLLKPVSLAPSLSWLAAKIDVKVKKEKNLLWIAGEDTQSTGISGLARIVHECRPLLEGFGFQTVLDQELSSEVNNATCLVMAAHGGLSTDGQFFTIFSNEGNQIIGNGKSLASIIGTVDLIIVFSCSAGRVDRHIDSVASVSFMTELLVCGCRTVIAPTWPFEVRSTKPWLDTFFSSFSSGDNAATACFNANKKLSKLNGEQPQLSINMTVFGDATLKHG